MASIPPPPYDTIIPASTPPPYSPRQPALPFSQRVFFSSPVPPALLFHRHQALSTSQLHQIFLPSPPLMFIPQLTVAPNVVLSSLPWYTSEQPTFETAPPFPDYVPGHVPSWVPRELRYEWHRGVLTPIEHFAGPSTPLVGRGWNTLHGYDAGPLPPGFPDAGIALADPARDLGGIAGQIAVPGAEIRNEAAGDVTAQTLGAGDEFADAEGRGDGAAEIEADELGQLELTFRYGGRVMRSGTDKNLGGDGAENELVL